VIRSAYTLLLAGKLKRLTTETMLPPLVAHQKMYQQIKTFHLLAVNTTVGDAKWSPLVGVLIFQ
jgi:hypothetical protein